MVFILDKSKVFRGKDGAVGLFSNDGLLSGVFRVCIIFMLPMFYSYYFYLGKKLSKCLVYLQFL